MNLKVSCWNGISFLRGRAVNPPVSNSLPDNAFHRCNRTISIVASERGPVVIPELIFSQIAMQVLLAAVLVDALHAALENAEIASTVLLWIVRSSRFTFAAAVRSGAVGGEELAHVAVATVLVGHYASFAGDIGENDRHEGFSLHVVDNHSASFAGFTVNQRQNLHLVMEGALLLNALEVADERLVNFDHAASTAERGKVAIGHRFTDTVSKEPRALVGDFQNAVELMGADALLAAGHQIDGLHSLVKREAHVFEHRADLDRELLLAVTTAPQANTNALFRARLYLRDAIHAATVRANRLTSPNDLFEVGESGFFTVKLRTGKGRHGVELLA